MTDAMTRVRSLIALATNSGATQEEARSAAHKACLLIVEHKMQVVMASAPQQSRWIADDHPAPQPKAKPKMPADPTCRLCNGQGYLGSEEIGWMPCVCGTNLEYARARHASGQKAPRPKPRASHWADGLEPAQGRRIDESRFDGICRYCGQDYFAGEKVWWYGPSKCEHYSCALDRVKGRGAHSCP
jgi:hypothetical protein